MGAVHRYKSAICFSMINDINNAFIQLFRIAEKGKYYNYYEIEKEKAFSKLQKDKRWEQVIHIIKLNAKELEKQFSAEIPQ
jgi:hypothetical protein